jgi:CelD/BcsL family acetyltransferase involved in cellulose biosynthesis
VSGLRTNETSDLAGLAGPWDDLVSRIGADPFMSVWWTNAWFTWFAPHRRPCIVTVWRGNELAAVLPLDRRWQELSWGERLPALQIPADSAEAAAALASAVFAGGHGRVGLTLVDATDPGLSVWRHEARTAGYDLVEEHADESPFIALAGTWGDFEAGLEAKFVRELRRRRRRLDEVGQVEVELLDGTRELDRALSEGFGIEGSGWKSAEGSAVTSDASRLAFFTDIARSAARRGALRLAFLRLDGRPIAFQFSLVQGGAYYFVKGGYDVEYRRYSPGQLLVAATIEASFAAGLDRFEFLGSADAFKLDWTNTFRDRLRVTATARSPRGLVATVAGKAVPLASRVLRRVAVPARALLERRGTKGGGKNRT